MTAQEKAKELVQKFKPYSYYDAHDLTTRQQRERSNIDNAIECAVICVDEIIDQLETIKEFVDDGSLYRVNNHINYYEKVKEEINKI